MLTEGNSLRAITRMAGCSINTVSKLLVDVGTACAEYQDNVMRDLTCERIEADEIWSFVHAKQRNLPPELQGEKGYGDVYTFVAMDADTKMVLSWLVGERTWDDAAAFMADLAPRLSSRVQITTDGFRPFVAGVKKAFGVDVDYATMIKYFKYDSRVPKSMPPITPDERPLRPGRCIGTETRVRSGNPDPAKISTAYVERQNLTIRMGMRRFTRLTNAFSKKIENHSAAVALHFMHYNFVRPHSTLKNPYPRTPALAAGIADHVWTLAEIARLAE